MFNSPSCEVAEGLCYLNSFLESDSTDLAPTLDVAQVVLRRRVLFSEAQPLDNETENLLVEKTFELPS
jgi:hypothetical protein